MDVNESNVLWKKVEDYKHFSAKRDAISRIFGGCKSEYMPYERLYSTLGYNDLINLIEEAKREKWEILDLSNTGISELPEELWELTDLKVLFIGNDFDENTIENPNSIREISNRIQQLVNLEAISICTLKHLKIPKSMKYLPRLVYLDCFKCDFEVFPYNLLNCRLKAIGIDCNNEDVLKRICAIKNMRELYLTWSNIKSLPTEICNLKKLELIALANSQVKEIPDGMCILENIKHFWIANTPLEKEIPKEILEQSAIEVISYICRQQTGAQKYYCNESKMIIVGQGNVGKSCLLERIRKNKYEEKESTEGIAIQKWTYTVGRKKDTYVLNIWDFGGQEIYHSTHQFFLTKRSLYVFVWDARAEEEYGRVDYWLKTIESFAEDSPIIIAINKCDSSVTRINRIDFESYKRSYPQIKTIIDISCKDNINISRLRNIIKREASKLPIMKIKWFYEWYQIRMELEKIGTEKKYISYSEYREICKKYELEEKEISSLSKYLHDLGIILHYDDDILLRGIIILSPEWVTEAVYKILDSQETILKKRSGILKIDDLPAIWSNKELYPEEKYVFLLKIMEKFQLCFEVVKGEYLVAELLENTALEIPKGWNLKNSNVIRVVYQYDFMPAGVMTRFIVAANQYLAVDKNNERLCWKKGAYMRYRNAYASVIMTDSITEKKIEVMVNKASSPNDAKELMNFIRQKLREINSTFKKLSVEEFVPCNCNEGCTYLYPYETLCTALDKGQGTIQCYKSFENVDVLKLLEGIAIKKNEEKGSMYTINVENNPVIKNKVTLESHNSASQEQKMDIKNIHIVLNEIQGYLHELNDELNETATDAEVIIDIEKAGKALENIDKADDKAQILKSGKLNKLKRLIEGFSAEDGEYRKLLSGGKNIIKIVSELVTKYNTLAAALGINLIDWIVPK